MNLVTWYHIIILEQRFTVTNIFLGADVMDQQLDHFSHHHPLSLVHLKQPNHQNENDDDDNDDEMNNEEEDKDDFVEEVDYGRQCNMCKEQIWSSHLCYYKCTSCDHLLHKFCAELPPIQQNHPLHPGHILILNYPRRFDYKCISCKLMLKNVYFYQCFECEECMDIVCAAMSEYKINHPSHPHQLEQMPWPIVSNCVACGNKHEGVFFHCTTCPRFWINLDCALLPPKLFIQNHTNGIFTHSHPLTLSYSFLDFGQVAKFYPSCRVCGGKFYYSLWIYKCDKCRYYVHVDCSTSKREPFMSIFLPAWLGKTLKNYKEDEHPNLLHCPFEDEGENLLKRHMTSYKQMTGEQHDGEMHNHSSHQHPLILFDKETLDSIKTVTLHNPMKRIQLLCDGCVKPIVTVPFYVCGQYVDGQCCFVLHEWCAKLPSQVQDYVDHPEHTLFLIQKFPDTLFGV
ncbi:uncharacterized protein LOC143537377 [Bidens hawaiensis]|uniref:uncharacterized protein LOC143537377 n=1 Tax=Bidens hawaiensis TaxID=980011 RepID=UPI004048F2C3